MAAYNDELSYSSDEDEDEDGVATSLQISPGTSTTDDINFLMAAKDGKVNTMQAYLNLGGNINLQNPGDNAHWYLLNNRGATALYMAAQQGHEEACEFLLNHGADPNLATSKKETPLHKAAYRGMLHICQRLIAAGAKPDAQGYLRFSPLHYAVGSGETALCQLLIDNGADVNKQSDAGTPLHWAASKGQRDAVRLLLANDAQVNAVSEGGNSQPIDYPLHRAAKYGQATICKLLLEKGADVNATAHDKTALYIACTSNIRAMKLPNKRFEIVKVLFNWAKIQAGGKYRLNDNDLEAIGAAARSNNLPENPYDIIKLWAYFACRSESENAQVVLDSVRARLIQNTHNPDFAENYINEVEQVMQYPPLCQYAYFGEIPELLQLLRSNSDLAQVKTADGQTALDILIEAGYVDGIFTSLIIQSNYNLRHAYIEACKLGEQPENTAAMFAEVCKLLKTTQRIIVNNCWGFLSSGLKTKPGEDDYIREDDFDNVLGPAVFTEFRTTSTEADSKTVEERFPTLATVACEKVIKKSTMEYFSYLVDNVYNVSFEFNAI